MKIEIKKRIPLKYIKDLVLLRSKAWEYGFEGCSKLNYWLSVLHCSTDYVDRQANWIALAIDKGRCIGFLEAYLTNRPKHPRPLFFLTNVLIRFILRLSKQGRGMILWQDTYLKHNRGTVEIGKYILDDFGKVPEGITVAVDPEYRKTGIYKSMMNKLMNEIDDYFIFHTSTESVYQAHEKLGFKKLYEVPFAKMNGEETTFIMYARKSEFLSVSYT